MYLKSFECGSVSKIIKRFWKSYVRCTFFAVQKSVYIHGADNISLDHKVMELKELVAESDWNSVYKSSWQHIVEMLLRRYFIFA